MIGTALGPYRVVEKLGEGGMGEVYRARDTKLNRDVALKILPESFALDPDRLARFKREAHVLASLNHPNIGGIYGFEESDGVPALVLELVEGPTLADHLANGPVPLDEALPIARQIAEALEAAHEQGIIHRDLKPANIKVRPDGMVKVLDFGLAKALARSSSLSPTGGEGRGEGGGLSQSPTITSPAMMTGVGVLLGTAAYMSPEQAKGRVADKRSDVWAFGCVLYEMLTGKRAFAADGVTETLALIITREPDLSALPTDTPAQVRRLLRRCLHKVPKDRLHDSADARLELQEAQAKPETAEHLAAAPARRVWERLTLAVGGIAVGVALGLGVMAYMRSAPRDASAVQFTIAPPEDTSFGGPSAGGTGTATQLAISPDSRNIAFVSGAQLAYQIWLRPVAAQAATPIPGTEGGTFPFWSPDSRFIGFFAGGKLKKVAVAGGPPIVLCDAPSGRGGSWSGESVILFSPSAAAGTGLMRVSSAGGVPTVVTKVDPAAAETNHRWPHFLPDGRHFIYTASTGACCPAATPSAIRIGSLEPAEAETTVLQAESSVTYASGHLLYARDETLMAQPFDPGSRALTGDGFPLAEHVGPEGSRYVSVSASHSGTLVYAQDGSQAPRQLMWFDRTGRALGTLGDAAQYSNPALSPDEKRVALALATGSPGTQDTWRNNLRSDIWIIDLARNLRSRLTVDPGMDRSPVWSPDSRRIVFAGERSGKVSLRQKLVDGTAPDEALLESSDNVTPTDWSADAVLLRIRSQMCFRG